MAKERIDLSKLNSKQQENPQADTILENPNQIEKTEEQDEILPEDGNDSNQSFSGQNPKHRIVVNVAQTEYDVIKKVARKVCNWRLKYFEEDHEGAIRKGVGGQKLSPVFDLSWHDLSIAPDFLSKLLPY